METIKDSWNEERDMSKMRDFVSRHLEALTSVDLGV